MAVSTGVGTVTVDFNSLKRLVREAGVGLPENAEVVFGNVRMKDDGALEFSFAWDNDDCHPTEWADAPEWLVLGR